ncbi:stAR-related lipid transfer protein 4 isoform X3 [Calonectris borealis]|uniref:stAR-related lipid transfer protein 4 isoform X3 n=1 Tax=Calonectris borealis TaxID=1323832 RepID=UPI003F4B083A
MDLLPNSAPLARKLRNTLIQYHSTRDSEWRVAKKTKDATVWRKPSEEFSGYLYKAQGVVEDVTNRIVDHIRPGPYRLDWDSLMTTMDIMETFEENCCVMRYTTAGQLWNIIAPREFVDFSYTTSYKDGLLTCGISLDYGEDFELLRIWRKKERNRSMPAHWSMRNVPRNQHLLCIQD